MMNDELRKQVAAQCKAVAHMATAIAQVYSDKARLIKDGSWPGDLNLVGRWSADLMETLGNTLNGMDAVTEEDDWMDPVFKEAHRTWPASRAHDDGGR